MALKVGELYGELSLKTDQFDRGLNTAGQKMSAFGSLASSTGKIAAGVFTAAVGGATALGVALVNVGIDYNRMQQASRAALTTLLGSAEAANAQMDKLDDFARNSPFAKQVFIQAQQQLLGFGFAADEVLPTLDAIQNAVAATGGSSQQVGELALIFAKVRAAAKFTAEDLNQFAERGVNAAELIGAGMGKTGAEIRESITKGTLDADAAIAALTEQMATKFGGATDLIKQQFDGAADRVKGAFRDIGSAIAAPLVDPNGGGYLVVWTNLVADAMRAAEKRIRPTIDLLVTRFGPAIDQKVTQTLKKAKDAIDAVSLDDINDGINTLAQYSGPIAGVATALLTLGGNSLGLSRLGLAINPVAAGVAALVAASPELRSVVIAAFREFEPLLPIVSDLAKGILNLANEAIGELAPEVGDLLEKVLPLAVAMAGDLAPSLVGVVDAGTPLVSLLADLVALVADIPAPVLLGVAAFIALQGPLRSLAPALSSVATGFAQFRDMSRVQAHLGNTSTLMGGLSVASMSAQGAISKVGTALKAAFITNPIGIAITAVATAIGMFSMNAENARARAETYADAVRLVGEEAEIAAGKVAAKALIENDDWGWFQKMKSGYDSAADAVEGLGLSLEETANIVGASQPEFDAYIERLEGMKDETGRNWGAIQELITKLYQQRTAWEDAAHGARQEADAVRDNTAATEENARAKEEAAAANLSEAQAKLRAEEQTIRATDAIKAATEAQDEATKVNADASKSEEEKAAATRKAEDAARAAEDAILNQVQADLQHIESMSKSGATTDAMRAATQRARDSFVAQRIAMGDTQAQAEKLADSYGLIPSNVTTTVNAVGNAWDVVDNIVRKLTDINGRTYTATIQVNRRGEQVNSIGGAMRFEANGGIWSGGMKRFADGGYNAKGQYVPRVSQIVAGGANIMWGEPETGWEAYISGKPSQRNRNIRILDETAARFGMRLTRYANGGQAGGGGSASVGREVPLIQATVSADSLLAAEYGRQAADALIDRLEEYNSVYGMPTGRAV